MIEVGRNSIIVRNVDKESDNYKTAISRYSVWDKVYFKYTMSAIFIDGDDMYFPSSIGLKAIQNLFPKEEIIVNYGTAPNGKAINYQMKHQPRDELQRKSIQFMMKIKTDNDQRQRFLSLETGSGKTYVTINCISKLKKKAMIIVDTIALAEQWKKEFLNHTDLVSDDIIILSGQEIVDKEIVKQTGKIYIAIHRTLGNMLTNDSNSVNKLIHKLGIGVRVFDESHVDFANICKINALSNVQYTFYLTATPSRSNFLDNSLYAKVFREIPYFNGKDISGEKYHTVVLITFDSKPSLDDKILIKTKYGFSQSKWAQYIYEYSYDSFLETIVTIFDKFNLLERKKKVAIMLPTIDLIKKLKESLEENYKNKIPEIGTFIGEIPKTKRLEELNKMVILTNDKIFDKGIDVKDLEILINCVPISSLVKTEQIMGRLRNRENYSSILIDVTDIGFDECLKQQKIRKRYYKKNAKKIIELVEK